MRIVTEHHKLDSLGGASEMESTLLQSVRICTQAGQDVIRRSAEIQKFERSSQQLEIVIFAGIISAYVLVALLGVIPNIPFAI